MIGAAWIATGMSLVGVVFVDIVWTSLGVSHGSGPLTSVVLGAGWRLATPLRRRSSHRWLAISGVATVLSPLAVWVVLLWTGWSVIFLGTDGGIVDSAGTVAGAWDKVYFAGYSLFTLGNGDFQPVGAVWQIASVATALSGLTVVSLAIAYLVLVVSAAADRRAVAVRLSLLADSPGQLASWWWASERRQVLDEQLLALVEPIVYLTQRHLAYPVLHFFHSSERRASPPVAVMMLDDALTLLICGLTPSERPAGPGVNALRQAIGDYLRLVGGHGDDHAGSPPLSLTQLEAAGAPVIATDSFNEAIRAVEERRYALHSLIAGEGFGTGPGNR